MKLKTIGVSKAFHVQEGILSRIAIIALALLLILPFTANADVTWHQTGGPEGGIVLTLAIDPANGQAIYAGTFRGFYKSFNGGTSWSIISREMDVRSLAFDPTNSQTIYAGGFGGLYKSTDGGTTWSTVKIGLGFTNIYSLAIWGRLREGLGDVVD